MITLIGFSRMVCSSDVEIKIGDKVTFSVPKPLNTPARDLLYGVCQMGWMLTERIWNKKINGDDADFETSRKFLFQKFIESMRGRNISVKRAKKNKIVFVKIHTLSQKPELGRSCVMCMCDLFFERDKSKNLCGCCRKYVLKKVRRGGTLLPRRSSEPCLFVGDLD